MVVAACLVSVMSIDWVADLFQRTAMSPICDFLGYARSSGVQDGGSLALGT